MFHYTLREKCLYLEFFWSVFYRIQTVSLYSFRMRENTDEKNSEYGHFVHSDTSSTTYDTESLNN